MELDPWTCWQSAFSLEPQLKARLWSEKMTASVLSTRCGLNQKRDKPPWIMIAKHLALAARVKPNTMAQNVSPLFLCRLVFNSYPQVHGKLSAEVTCACPSYGKKMSGPEECFCNYLKYYQHCQMSLRMRKQTYFHQRFQGRTLETVDRKGSSNCDVRCHVWSVSLFWCHHVESYSLPGQKRKRARMNGETPERS